MKTIAYIIAVVAGSLVGLAVMAAPKIGIGAGELTQQVAGEAGYDVAGVTDTTLSQSVGRLIKIALSLVGTIFLALTIYAGVLWMTAQGNEEQVEKAINIVKRAMLGLMVVMAAYGLTVFVLLAITASSGVPGAQVGGADIGAGGFWKSFGSRMKDYRFWMP